MNRVKDILREGGGVGEGGRGEGSCGSSGGGSRGSGEGGGVPRAPREGRRVVVRLGRGRHAHNLGGGTDTHQISQETLGNPENP